MSFHVVKGDIFDQKVDAIVLTTSPKFELEGSLGIKASKKCGKRLVLEMEQIKKPSLSQCVITNAYNLPSSKIIHVVTPYWHGGNYDEEEYLRKCYINCLEKLKEFDLTSIAFPLLSSGANAFSNSRAAAIAMQTLIKYTNKNEDLDIVLVIYKQSTWDSCKHLFKGYVVEGGKLTKAKKASMEEMLGERTRNLKWYTRGSEQVLYDGVKAQELKQKLLFYIKSKGKTQTDCYSGIISKAGFDKIVSGVSKRPTKNTIISLGVNIGLDEYEINDLLSPLGEMLSPYIERDQLITRDIWQYKGRPDIVDLINKDLVSLGFVPLKTDKD